MTHAHTKAGGQAWEGRAARRPLGGSTRTQRGSPARRNLSQHAILQPAGHHGYRGVPTNQLLPCAPSSRRALRVEFSGSGFSPVAHCIFLRTHVTPSVPVRGGRHVVQIWRSPEGRARNYARPTGDGKARAVRRGCNSARVRQWLTRIEREGSPQSGQIDSPVILRPQASAPTVHVLQTRFFLDGPTVDWA